MNFQRLSAWFLKESGKKFVFGTAVATSIAIGCVQIVPHTFLLEKYKEVVHLYTNGFTVPVPKPLFERFKKTVDLLEIEETDKKQFKPFMVLGFDIFSAGSFFSRYGVLVGLPINYTYIDADYIDKSRIRILEHAVPWETEQGSSLLTSLTVSENAQMYGIAREIQMRQTPKYYIDLISSVSLFIAAYSTGGYINERFNLFAKSRAVRLVMYSLLGTFTFLNYIFIQDATQVYYERKTDEYLKNKSPIFKEGGKEFYEGILKRNIVLRSFMGKVGEHNYSQLGNENYLFRQRHLPLVQRKAFFDDSHSTIEHL